MEGASSRRSTRLASRRAAAASPHNEEGAAARRRSRRAAAASAPDAEELEGGVVGDEGIMGGGGGEGGGAEGGGVVGDEGIMGGGGGGGAYACMICLQNAGEETLTVTACGHLFCWPCLRRWLKQLEENAIRSACPVCRFNIFGDSKKSGLHPFAIVARIRNAASPSVGQLNHDFSCGICERQEAVEPVLITNCGHVYCWACLAPQIRNILEAPSTDQDQPPLGRCSKRQCRRPRFHPSWEICAIYTHVDGDHVPAATVTSTSTTTTNHHIIDVPVAAPRPSAVGRFRPIHQTSNTVATSNSSSIPPIRPRPRPSSLPPHIGPRWPLLSGFEIGDLLEFLDGERQQFVTP